MLNRCVRGATALAAGAFFERGLRLVVYMILSRVLVPDQFGLMAIVLASIGFFETFTEVGVRQCVVQSKNGEKDGFLNIAWWFSGIRGLLLFIAGFLSAGFIAGFYSEPLLDPILKVAFLTMLFQGLVNPRLYVLEKKLQFGRYVWITQGAKLTGTLLTLTMALWVRNVWVLVIGYVVQSALRCIASHIFCPSRVFLRFDRVFWNEIFAFSRRMAGVPILTYLFMQADIFILGKMCTLELVGLYSMALTLATTPQMLFSQIAGPMILPVLSDSQDSMAQIRSRLLRMTRFVFSFGLPMMTCLAVFSKSILTVLYGVRYAPVSGAFAFLGYYVLIYISGLFIFSVYIALARPDVHRWFTTVRVLLFVVLVYPAVQWYGPTGAAAARMICLILAGVVQQFNLSRLIRLPVSRYLSTANQGIVLSIFMLIPAIVGRESFDSEYVHLAMAGGLCGLAWGYIALTNIRLIREFLVGIFPNIAVQQ